mgnify:CR=1 FL=1
MTVVVDFKNSVTGFLHYFQIHRFYWLYPADWYLEFALAAAVLWRTKVPHTDSRMLPGKLVILAVCLLPTLQLLKVNSGMYLNVNQINKRIRNHGIYLLGKLVFRGSDAGDR